MFVRCGGYGKKLISLKDTRTTIFENAGNTQNYVSIKLTHQLFGDTLSYWIDGHMCAHVTRKSFKPIVATHYKLDGTIDVYD